MPPIPRFELRSLFVMLPAALLLSGCFGSDDNDETNDPPSFLGSVTRSGFDGVTDDLLTAGLGKTGLASATAPGFANATAPTTSELRRSAIWNNYRALVDVTTAGGYGVLFGPNIDINGGNTLGEGMVPGIEYLAYADDGSGTKNVTLLVQIPNGWNRERPCVVTGTSSGSRGVYGAIGTAGEWGLKHRCAVAYADKGSGMGFHDLATDTVHLIDGTRTGASGKNSNFTSLTGATLATFNAATPNRLAVKHAHSQQNPEKDWGYDTLNAIRFAIWALNEERGDRTSNGEIRLVYKPENVVVIASSVSNGGGAAVAAAELDTDNLVDGVAVSEPSVYLTPNSALRIVRGSNTFSGAGRSLYDYFTLANLLQPCASQSSRAANSPGLAFVTAATATNRCVSLRARGILTSTSAAALPDEALDLLLAYGWESETIPLHASHYAFATPGIAMTYANTYGRFSVADNACGFSFAGVDASGAPAPLAAASLAQSFGTGNGVPPTAGIQIINNNSVGGPVRDAISVSPSTGVADFNIDGALCQRELWTGTTANATAVQTGVGQIARSGNLRGKPAIIVHGRSDTLIPVNFTSRAYFGQNRIAEGTSSRLSYIEVTNAQHFDAFIGNPLLAGYDTRFIPLHYYYNMALDRMWAHLTAGAALPPSQVVRTTPRGGTAGQAPAIAVANVPPIVQSPTTANAITFVGTTVTIPD